MATAMEPPPAGKPPPIKKPPPKFVTSRRRRIGLPSQPVPIRDRENITLSDVSAYKSLILEIFRRDGKGNILTVEADILKDHDQYRGFQIDAAKSWVAVMRAIYEFWDRQGDRMKAAISWAAALHQEYRKDGPIVEKYDALVKELFDPGRNTLELYSIERAEGMASGHGMPYGHEDMLVYYLFFSMHDRPDGSFRFLEVGVQVNVADTSTYYFQKNRNWRGFVVDADVDNTEHLKQTRAINGTKLASPKAVCRQHGHTVVEGQKVSCDTLGNILSRLNNGESLPILHFWSLNCDGCEDHAIRTFNWDATKVAILMIKPDRGKNCLVSRRRRRRRKPDLCAGLLRDHGMKLWGTTRDSYQIWFSPDYFAQVYSQVLPLAATGQHTVHISSTEWLDQVNWFSELLTKQKKSLQNSWNAYKRRYEEVKDLQNEQRLQKLIDLVNDMTASTSGFHYFATKEHAVQKSTVTSWLDIIDAKASFYVQSRKLSATLFWEWVDRFKAEESESVLQSNHQVAQGYQDIIWESVRAALPNLDFFSVQDEVSRLTGHAAQDGAQDLIIYHAFFSNQDKHEGRDAFIYLEIGADSGLGGSNTYLFERKHNWSGFLIEPAESQSHIIRQNRDMTKARLACPSAVCGSKGEVPYFGGGQGGSTVADRREIKHETNNKTVPCDSMSGIVRGLNAERDPPIIHFWSLDCEGCEWIALQSFDFDKTDVAVLLIELTPGSSCAGDIAWCERFLFQRGFRLWLKLNPDQIWYSEKYFNTSDHPLPTIPPKLGDRPASDNAQFVDFFLRYLLRISHFGRAVAEVMHLNVEAMGRRYDELYRLVHKLD